MCYQIRDNLSFCQTEGQVIFLDIANDRYFRLSSTAERALVAYLQGNEGQITDVDDLPEHRLLRDAAVASHITLASPFEVPARSALEEAHSVAKAGIGPTTSIIGIVCTVWWRLRTCRLKDILDSLATLRSATTANPCPPPETLCNQRLIEAATVFRTVRQYIPIGRRCLLDSIALTRFLAERGLHANVVFGVIGDPFSAHCWVQAGDLVLSDTTGNANAHTPIRIV